MCVYIYTWNIHSLWPNYVISNRKVGQQWYKKWLDIWWHQAITRTEPILTYHHWGPVTINAWWCHQMETFPALLALCVGNSPHKGQWRTTLMFFFDLHLNKWLSKQPWGWWFETPSRSLWRCCNGKAIFPRELQQSFTKISLKIIYLKISF